MTKVALASFLAAASLVCGAALSQEYPAKPVTIIVPFSAGGGGDVVTRTVTPSLAKTLGRPVLVENLTGAGGTIGSKKAAQAAPDGYTLIMVSPGTHAGAPALYANLGYEPVEGHEQIGLMSTTAIVLIGKKALPPNTLQEFVAYLRANEKSVTSANAGVGSMSHLACSLFHSLISVDPTQVSYRGMPPLMLDLLAGRVDYVCQQANGIIGQLDAIKVYAVADERRASLLPNVPTTTEAGLPGFKSTVWLGLAAPKGTPQPVIQTLNRALAVAFDDGAVQKRYADLGLDIPIPEQRSPEWFRKFMQAEMERWTGILRKAGVKPAQ